MESKYLLKLFCYKIVEKLIKVEDYFKCKGLAYAIIRFEIGRNYEYFMHKKINLTDPTDLNEKINWLKLHESPKLWAELADKFAVRKFIESKGLSDILVPLYGVYNSASDIDFDKLPNSFVLKTNHGSGDVVIVKDKSNINRKDIIKRINKFLKMPYGVQSGEPHYLFIKPRVIAEELIIPMDHFSTSLIDYKIWCFNGEPQHIWACYSRTKHEVKVETYDLEWNHHPEFSVFNHHYVDGGGNVPKPENLAEMLDIARKLSNNFKQVRVDLYNNGGKIYFGEMTFTGNGGYMDFYTQDFLNEMGTKIEL